MASFAGRLWGSAAGALQGAVLGFLVGGPVGAAWGAGVGAAVGYVAGNWVDQQGVPRPRPTEQRSATYGLAGPNPAGPDLAVPVVYGTVRVTGPLVYRGGAVQVLGTTGALERIDGAVEADFFVALSEGPIYWAFDPAADRVPLAHLEGARSAVYQGTAVQAADNRFATLRHYHAAELTVWDAELPGVSATTSFASQAAGATVRLHLRGQLAAEGAKSLTFRVEYQLAGTSTWVDAGAHRLSLAASEYGQVDIAVPLGAATETYYADYVTTQTATWETWTAAEGVEVTGWTYRSHQVVAPGAVALAQAVPVRQFPAGTHLVRVTLLGRTPAGEVTSGRLTLAGLIVEERDAAQALRHLAYLAATIPAAETRSAAPQITAVVAGRQVPVWDGAAWVTRWTANPVWQVRDLLTHTRYGLGLTLTAPEDERLKTAAAYCDVTVRTVGAARTVTGSGVGWLDLAGIGPGEDLTALKLVSGGVTRRVAYHDRAAGRVWLDVYELWEPYLDLVFVEEPRFHCCLTLDTRADAEEQLRKLLSHCRGRLWWDAGEVYVAIDGLRATARTLGPSELVAGSLEYWHEDAGEVPEALTVRYVDPAQDWQRRGLTVGTRRAVGRVEEREWLGCLHRTTAERLGAYVLALAARTARCRFTATLAGAALEPGDVVELYHPVPPFGYDVTDPDNPVQLGAGSLFEILSTADGAEGRVYECRQYDPAIYSDTAQLSAPTPATAPVPSTFGPPAPVAGLVLRDLGDLTPDGIFNPVAQVSWTHPAPATVASWRVYQSADAGASWFLAAEVGALGPVVWRYPPAAPTLRVRVVPVGHGGRAGAWTQAPEAVLAAPGDLTPPAAPTGFTVSYTTRLSVVWTPATEADFDHYRCTIDDWATTWRVYRANAEVLQPSSRQCVFRVVAVDRSGNVSAEASTWCELPAPPAPAATSLGDLVDHDRVILVVDAAEPRPPGWVGWRFEWRVQGGTWADVVPEPAPFAVWQGALPLGTSATLEWRYAAADVFGTGAWSDPVTGVSVSALGELADLDLVATEYLAHQAVTSRVWAAAGAVVVPTDATFVELAAVTLAIPGGYDSRSDLAVWARLELDFTAGSPAGSIALYWTRGDGDIASRSQWAAGSVSYDGNRRRSLTRVSSDVAGVYGPYSHRVALVAVCLDGAAAAVTVQSTSIELLELRR